MRHTSILHNLRRHSLQARLIRLLLAIGLVPLAIVSIISSFQTVRVVQQDTQNQLANLTTSVSDKLDRILFERYSDVQIAASTQVAVSMDPSAIADFMDRSIVLSRPFYRLMVVADLNGRVVAVNRLGPDGQLLNSQSLVGKLVVGERWFSAWQRNQTQRGDSYVDFVHVDPRVAQLYGGSGYVMGFSSGIFDDSGALVGVWLNIFDWQVAQQILQEQETLAGQQGSPSVRLSIVNKAGIILAGGEAGDILRTRYQASPTTLRAETISAGYSSYRGLDWLVMATRERDEAYRPIYLLRLQIILATLVSAVGVLLTGILTARAISRPLQTLQQAAQTVAGGNLSTDVPDGADEIGQLGAAFNHMTGELRSLYAGMEAQVVSRTADLQATLDELRDSTAMQQRLTNTINTLSIPILPLSSQVLAVPLIGNFDQKRAMLLLSRLLQSVEEAQARAVLIDVTGLEVMDAAVAQLLLKMINALRLLGCQVVLVGIRPEIAESIISLGVDVRTLITHATLQQGLFAVQAFLN